jgi:hypothetical protein
MKILITKKIALNWETFKKRKLKIKNKMTQIRFK